VSAGERGIALTSGDDAFSLRLRGLLQVDSRWFLRDTALDDRDSMLIRRARPILDATVLRIVDLRLVPDFAEGRAQVFDAYLDVRPRPWLKVRAGKFKPPIGLERLQGDPDMPFNERALSSNLSPARDTGAQLFATSSAGSSCTAWASSTARPTTPAATPTSTTPRTWPAGCSCSLSTCAVPPASGCWVSAWPAAWVTS
jgi:phosphate-selective porin OprO/OprP